MQKQKPRVFKKDDHQSWKSIYAHLAESRDHRVFKIFSEGLKALDISGEKIPNLKGINLRLKKLTGFEGVFVNGLEEGETFYRMLADRKFPVGNFIRSKDDLTYTPEPDIVHDLFGHLPFLANPDYANFCQQFGQLACQFSENPTRLRPFERFFWFTIEFGLIKTPEGRRIFGAGIASSIGECTYALSPEPEVIPFDIGLICQQEFRIDEMQKKLFILESTEQLYQSLPQLKRIAQ